MPVVILAIGLGAVIGVLLGLLGGGGSILAVPALVYGAGLTLSAAVPMSLLVVGVSSATALLPRLRAGLVRWRIAAVVGGTGAAAAFAGRYRPVGPAAPAQPGTLEHWLTERYCLYALHDGRVLRAHV